jgi:hypothetical protein
VKTYSSIFKKIKTKIFKSLIIISGNVIALGAIFVFYPALVSAAPSTVIYNNIPSPIPGNVPSEAYQATQTSEFGGQVQFSGTNRYNPVVTVLMSSWGCQTGGWSTNNCVTTPGSTFSEPITLNIYNVNTDNSPGSLLTTLTQTFNIPFRPSANNTNCTAGEWYDTTNSSCYNGLDVPINFDFTGKNVTLPTKAIISVAYNTSGYGAHPYGYSTACAVTSAGCGYDSLNVGTNPAPTVGVALPTINDAYLNSATPGQYCDSSLGSGTFRLDSGCWTGYLPAFEVTASASLTVQPTTKNECKDENWKQYNNPSFKNQGACIDWVQSRASGDLRMSGPSQRIEFNIANSTTNSHHDEDQNRDINTVEYWNYDYPGGLHYTAAVACTNINPLTNEARFMFQIPSGYPGLSGLYVVAYVKEINQRHTPDLYGHEATADLSTATQWCQTGVGFSPTMYPVTSGDVHFN